MKPKPKGNFSLPRSYYEGFDHCSRIFDTVIEKESQLAVLRKEIKFLKARRYMDTFHLFLERAMVHACTFVIGVLAAIALLLSTGCATTGGGSLVLKDGGFCVCVDPSSGELSPVGGWCYKANDVTVGAESSLAQQ